MNRSNTRQPNNYDVLQAVEICRAEMNRDARQTYDRVAATLVRLCVDNGHANAVPVNYIHSEIKANVRGYACVTVGVTNLHSNFDGNLVSLACMSSMCGNEWWHERNNEETLSTLVFLCPLPKPSYNIDIETASLGAPAVKDRRGLVRRALEDKWTVVANIRWLLLLIVMTIISYRAFDCSMFENYLMSVRIAEMAKSAWHNTLT